MKVSTDVWLTKVQRQGLIAAAERSLKEYPYEQRNPALRNAVKRLKKVDAVPKVSDLPEGSVIGAAASGGFDDYDDD